jgi:hypothetical protein
VPLEPGREPEQFQVIEAAATGAERPRGQQAGHDRAG